MPAQPRVPWRVAGASLAAGLAVVAASCGGGEEDSDPDPSGPPPGRACTLIGCSSGVKVQLARLPAGTRSARVCVDGTCGRSRVIRPARIVAARLPESSRSAGRMVRISVELKDGRGKTLRRLSGSTTVERSRPNGPDCPPVCFQANLRLGGAG